jgi:hypothetical protein
MCGATCAMSPTTSQLNASGQAPPILGGNATDFAPLPLLLLHDPTDFEGRCVAIPTTPAQPKYRREISI